MTLPVYIVIILLWTSIHEYVLATPRANRTLFRLRNNDTNRIILTPNDNNQKIAERNNDFFHDQIFFLGNYDWEYSMSLSMSLAITISPTTTRTLHDIPSLSPSVYPTSSFMMKSDNPSSLPIGTTSESPSQSPRAQVPTTWLSSPIRSPSSASTSSPSTDAIARAVAGATSPYYPNQVESSAAATTNDRYHMSPLVFSFVVITLFAVITSVGFVAIKYRVKRLSSTISVDYTVDSSFSLSDASSNSVFSI